MKILFFGSTTDSVVILDALPLSSLCAIVTQPPKPVGREKTITPTPVELWAKAHTIPLLTFVSDSQKSWLYDDEDQVISTLEPFKADIIVSASYGQKIPSKTISDAKFGGLNIHPSILPKWRGADPVPWAILSGDHQIGVTLVTLSDAFDEGKIIDQKKIPILPSDLSDPLRTKLFHIGAKMLCDTLLDTNFSLEGEAQTRSDTPYARKLTRQDGYEPWDTILLAQTDKVEAVRLDRKFRAFLPWPGMWTTINDKRVKILDCHLSSKDTLILDEVQLEGKNPVPFTQFRQSYLLSS